MNHADSLPVIASVKLFPRIANVRPRRRRRVRRVTAAERSAPITAADALLEPAADNVLTREELLGQLRTRLLQMILDHERARRHEQHPTAG